MPSTRGFWRKKSRGGSVWYCRHPVTGRQISTGCRDLTAAKLYRARIERLAADPAHPAAAPPDAYRLRHVADEMIRERAQAGKSTATLEVYACKLSQVVRVLGENLDVRRLTREIVADYIATRTDEQASRHTIHKELRALKVALKLAKAPTDAIPQYADGYTPRTRHLTREQFAAMHAEIQPHRRLDVLFLALTGARLGEYQRAELADVRGHVVWIRGTKTRSAARSVPLAPELAAAIAASKLPSVGPIFAPWPNLVRDLKAACTRAGVPPISTNDLRRSYCTWLRDAGVDEATCASLLGHSSSLMVRTVYGQTTDRRKQLAVSALGSVLRMGSSTVARSADFMAPKGRRVREKKRAQRR